MITDAMGAAGRGVAAAVGGTCIVNAYHTVLDVYGHDKHRVAVVDRERVAFEIRVTPLAAAGDFARDLQAFLVEWRWLRALDRGPSEAAKTEG